MLEGEELKQLLSNGAEFSQELEMLPEEDKNAIIELFNEPINAIAKAIKKILKKECELGEVSADIAKASLIQETLGEEYKLLDATYKTGISSFAIDITSVKKMASILLETMPEEGELSETELNAFGEIYSQMVVALGNSLARVTDANITIQESMEESKISELEENVLQLSIAFSVEEDVNTTMYYYISYPVVNALLGVLRSKMPKTEEKRVEKEKIEKTEELEEEITTAVQPICFEELTEDLVANQKENMNLLMDLQLQVSVELGKVKKPIKDILQFTQGTIVELDRLAGDNVDILVSGKIIAKGEVVVVDQNFGVRITKIVLPEKRV